MVNTLETDYPLFNMDLLGIKQTDRKWFTAVNIAVRTQMNTLDASHNYQHIRHVVSNAAHILEEEKKQHQGARDVDSTVVWVTCMAHDIGDTKYKVEGDKRDQTDIVDAFLRDLNCPLSARQEAAYIAPHISYSAEMSDEAGVQAFANHHPVLRIVQDADRLDGLGAVGVGRLFVCGAVNEVRRQGLIDSGIDLIQGRFRHYPRLMKTATGREVADERYKWMVDGFVRRWVVEAETGNVYVQPRQGKAPY
jgi:uncharacterized protein